MRGPSAVMAAAWSSIWSISGFDSRGRLNPKRLLVWKLVVMMAGSGNHQFTSPMLCSLFRFCVFTVVRLFHRVARLLAELDVHAHLTGHGLDEGGHLLVAVVGAEDPQEL